MAANLCCNCLSSGKLSNIKSNNKNFSSLVNDYSNFNDDELKERINCYDDNDGLYEELVDNVINPNVNQGGQF